MSTKKIAIISLYTALAVIIFMVESALPALAPLPFVKLGLANIITLMVLVYYSPKDAFFVLLLRICISSLFAGQIVYLWYSLAGGILCFFIEWMINGILKGTYVYITSIFGAIAHNMGQMTVAFLLMGKGVLPYIPYMLIAGVITGAFIGIAANTLISHIRRLRI